MRKIGHAAKFYGSSVVDLHEFLTPLLPTISTESISNQVLVGEDVFPPETLGKTLLTDSRAVVLKLDMLVCPVLVCKLIFRNELSLKPLGSTNKRL